MGLYKAPGPNGYSTSFYQHHWSIVELEITTSIVLSFLHGLASIEEINFTYLVLIPKKQHAHSVNDLGP